MSFGGKIYIYKSETRKQNKRENVKEKGRKIQNLRKKESKWAKLTKKGGGE